MSQRRIGQPAHPQGHAPRLGPWCDLAMAAAAGLCYLWPWDLPLWALGAFPLLAAARWLVAGRAWAATPIDAPLILLAVMGAVSLGITWDPVITGQAFLRLIAGIAMLAAVANWSDTLRRARWVIGGLGIIGLALVPLSFWPGIHANILAGALALLLPLALAVVVKPPVDVQHTTRVQHAGLLLAGAMGAALLFTRSRGAYMGAALGCALVLLLARRHRWLIPAGLALAALGWAVVWPALTANAAADDISSLAGRLEIWHRALTMLGDTPFTGIGMGTFNQVANAFYPFFLGGPNAATPHAHNLPLQVGVDLGVPGMVAFVALLGLLIWMATSIYRRRGDPAAPWARTLAIGLLGSYGALLAHGLVDAATWGTRPAALMWALFGLTVGVWRASLGHDLEPWPPSEPS